MTFFSQNYILTLAITLTLTLCVTLTLVLVQIQNSRHFLSEVICSTIQIFKFRWKNLQSTTLKESQLCISIHHNKRTHIYIYIYIYKKIQALITYSINIFADTVNFSPCDTGILSDDTGRRGEKERNSHNLIKSRSTSKITIKYVINRLLHGFGHIITRISPQKTSISPLQALGDMGFPWADTGWWYGKKHVILYYYPDNNKKWISLM